MIDRVKLNFLMLVSVWLGFSVVLNAEKEADTQPVVGPKNGSLVIMGGGGKDRAFGKVFRKFVELAGGKEAHIVIVPTAASSSPTHDYSNSLSARYARSLGVKSVTVVHTHDPKEADTDDFVSPLKKATGVWFNGGRQWRYVKAYGGTKSEVEFNKVLERGGAIGGSSAGASIQGSFLARGDTRGNRIMVGDVQRGFAYMKNTAIDQHVIARGREKDLLKVLEDPRQRMEKDYDRAEMLGIGIDEDVAIVVRADELEVIGKKNGSILIFDPKKWKKDTQDEEKWETLQTGDKYDLSTRSKIK